MTKTPFATSRAYPSLPFFPPRSSPGQARPLRICIASQEFAVATRHSGLGAAYTSLARALAAAGHEVTCLLLDAAHTAARNDLTLAPLPAIVKPALEGPPHLAKSFETFQWLRQNDRFDVIHFSAAQGAGYYTLLARQQGLAFGRSTICLGLHATTAWLKSAQQEGLSDLSELEMDFMEQQCVALADAVVSPSRDLLDWITERGWPLPANCFVQQDVLPLSGRANLPPVWQEVREMTVPPRANDRAWMAWHESLAGASRVEAHPADPPPKWPKVSVCLTTFNRPAFLRQAVASLQFLRYPRLEVVLVDEGSTQPEALALLQELQPAFDQRGWRLLRQNNRSCGQARNIAARHAKGDFFLFMAEDDWAEAQEISTLVRAALRTGADIVACGMNYFEGYAAPNLRAGATHRWLPLGGAAALGVFGHCFGDANSLVRRSCFERLGGFAQDDGASGEGFHARAARQDFKSIVVPEFLFWRRVNPDRAPKLTAALPKDQPARQAAAQRPISLPSRPVVAKKRRPAASSKPLVERLS